MTRIVRDISHRAATASASTNAQRHTRTASNLSISDIHTSRLPLLQKLRWSHCSFTTLAARGTSPADQHGDARARRALAPLPLNSELASAEISRPSTSTSTSGKSRLSRPATSSLPSRSTNSPYRDFEQLQHASRAHAHASVNGGASPRSQLSTELPPLASPLASSPGSANSPLPETPLSDYDGPFGSGSFSSGTPLFLAARA